MEDGESFCKPIDVGILCYSECNSYARCSGKLHVKGLGRGTRLIQLAPLFPSMKRWYQPGNVDQLVSTVV